MKKYPLNTVDYYTTFKEMIETLPCQREDQPAISWFNRKGQAYSVSLGDWREDIRNLQAYFIKTGLSGTQIAILGENSYEWLLVYFAAVYCGAIAVCVDIEQSDETITQMLDMVDLGAVFFAPAFDQVSRSSKNQVPTYSLLPGQEDPKSISMLLAEGKQYRETAPDYREADVTPDMTASIVFTSGTTSTSKPVMLSHEAILTNASDALANVSIGKTAFTSLPFYHTYGLTCSVLSMLIGKAQLYINGNLKTVMRDIQLAEPHTMLTVPLLLETIYSRIWLAADENGKTQNLKRLLKIKKCLFALGIRSPGKTLTALREKTFGKIRLIICGGAHMNSDIMKMFACMGVTVLQGYGITECAPLVSVNRNRANKFDSVGTATANCEIKIEDGEILVRGRNVMKGYYQLPELTAEAIRDGWFATGDLGYLDKDGFLFITGRKKNLIVFKNGKKLSPETLEEKLRTIPLVQDVIIYGSLRGMSTDDVQIAASIFPNKDECADMTQYEILEALQKEINDINKALPLYQQIQMINIREHEFSKTALQKIKRHMM